MAGRLLVIPFATAGDVAPIPDPVQPSGAVSFTTGFTLDYELPNTDPDYKPVPRDQTNELYRIITENIGIIQKQGVADWFDPAATGFSYAINAQVRHLDKIWQSVIPANGTTPGVGADWVEQPAFSVAGIRGAYSNLSASAVGTNATVSFAADAICVKNAANEQIVLNGVSESCNLLTSGAGGLDTGAIAGNLWYALYIIYNPTTLDVSSVASLNFAAPTTLPSGYTHWAFITSVRSNAGATLLLPFTKDNEVVFYAPTAGTAIPSDFPIAMGNGAATSFTAVSLQARVPPNAKSAVLGVTHSGTTAGSILVARGAAGAAAGLYAQCLNNGVATQRLQFEVAKPYANGVYYGINTSGVGTIVVMGWKE